MKRLYTILLLALTVALAAGCRQDVSPDTPGGDETLKPIAFNSEMQDMKTTRAAQALFNYQKSMKLYGSKTVSGVKKEVFPNYLIKYLDASKTWEYEAIMDASLTGQITKYWDHDATGYYFLAGAPYDATDISADGKTVTVNNLMAETSTATSPISRAYLYSEPKSVAAAEFDKTVMLSFHLALSRIKVAFIFKDAQTEAVTLSDISFGPASGNYATKGSLAVNYSSSSPVYTVTPTETSAVALDFQSVTIAVPGNIDNTYAEEVYYMIPHSSSATASDWTMTVGSLTEKNTATVDAQYMKWEPGHQYVYKFLLSSAKTDPTIKFIECVSTAITGWTDATASDATLYNW